MSDNIPSLLDIVHAELLRATKLHGPFASAHEGYAVLKEEADELWDEIKKRDRDSRKMLHEAVQVAAMAIRFANDVCVERGEHSRCEVPGCPACAQLFPDTIPADPK